MSYLIYSKPSCPYCTRAKQALTKLNLPYEEKIVGEDVDREELFELAGKPERLTVPQVFLKGLHIGGYDQLESHLDFVKHLEIFPVPLKDQVREFDDTLSVADVIARAATRQALREHVATITFTKRDGSERVMKCTLLADYLPPVDEDTEWHEQTENPDTLVVWDIEKRGWRSFRLDSVKRIVVGDL